MAVQIDLEVLLKGKRSMKNRYAMICDFGKYGSDYIYILAYNDAKNFEDVYNNYEKYQGNNNTFLELHIESYEHMDLFGWLYKQ